MDFKFSFGLFLGGILAGCSFMIGASQWVGIAILILTAIWGFLFLNPKSPVKRRWWSVSNKLGITPVDVIYNIDIGDSALTINVRLRTMSGIQVDEISLKIGRKRLVSDYPPMFVKADEERHINFQIPNWIRKGTYQAYLIAHTPDGFSKSKKQLIKVDV